MKELHNIKLEYGIIGLMIANGKKRLTFLEELTADDFQNHDTRKAFTIIKHLVDTNKPIDTISFSHEADRINAGILQSVQTEFIIDSLEIGNDIKSNISELKALSLRRNIRYAGIEIQEISEVANINDLKEDVEKIVYKSMKQDDVLEYNTMNVLINKALHNIDKISKGYKGITTGLKDFDNLNRWFEEGNFYVIGGRPGMGKTAFAVKLILEIAKQDIQVAFFSLEMTELEITNRMLSMGSGVCLDKIDSGKMNEKDAELINSEAAKQKLYPINIIDTPRLKKNKLFSKIRLLVRRGVKIVFIDHLILIDNKEAGQGRHQQIGDITQDLKSLAKELKIPIVALSQVRREVEERKDKRPYAGDMKESGDIEQDADCVIVLYRDDYYNADKPECKKNITEVIFRKKRNGRCGTCMLYTDLRRMKYETIPSHVDNY